MKQHYPLAISLLLLTAGISCGKVDTVEFKPAPVILTAEGPLFEGSNTAQGVLDGAELEDFLRREGHADAALRSARLVAVRISTSNDTLTLDDIDGITLQLAAPQVDMQNVAVLNPVPTGQNSVDLRVAAEQEQIASLIRQPALTFVADINLKKDIEADVKVICALVFELDVKN